MYTHGTLEHGHVHMRRTPGMQRCFSKDAVGASVLIHNRRKICARNGRDGGDGGVARGWISGLLSDRETPVLSQPALHWTSPHSARVAYCFAVSCNCRGWRKSHGTDGRPSHGPWLGRPETTSAEWKRFLATREGAQFGQPTILGTFWPREQWGSGARGCGMGTC